MNKIIARVLYFYVFFSSFLSITSSPVYAAETMIIDFDEETIREFAEYYSDKIVTKISHIIFGASIVGFIYTGTELIKLTVEIIERERELDRIWNRLFMRLGAPNQNRRRRYNIKYKKRR